MTEAEPIQPKNSEPKIRKPEDEIKRLRRVISTVDREEWRATITSTLGIILTSLGGIISASEFMNSHELPALAALATVIGMITAFGGLMWYDSIDTQQESIARQDLERLLQQVKTDFLIYEDDKFGQIEPDGADELTARDRPEPKDNGTTITFSELLNNLDEKAKL